MARTAAAFTAAIGIIGINPYVTPPEDALAALFARAGREKGPIPVRGTINGAPYAQTLVRYAGAWRLYVNKGMLEAANASLGDRARFTMDHDPRPRAEPMPAGLAAALEADAGARAAFAALSPSRRKEIQRYLNSAKTEATRARNVAAVIRLLKGGRGRLSMLLR